MLSFHHSSHLGGDRARGPKSTQKSSLFFFKFVFFLPKIQNYAMSHKSDTVAISLPFLDALRITNAVVD